MSYVIKTAKLISFLLLRHRFSAIFSAAVVNRAKCQIAPNRQLLSPIQPFRFVGVQKKFAQLFRATKSFQKQKNCRNHGTQCIMQGKGRTRNIVHK